MGLLDNAETVTIDNKEAQLITTSNNGILFQKDIYELLLDYDVSYYENSLTDNLDDFTVHLDERYGEIETTSDGTHLFWTYLKLNDFLFDMSRHNYTINFKSKSTATNANEAVLAFIDFESSAPDYSPIEIVGWQMNSNGLTWTPNVFHDIRLEFKTQEVKIYIDNTLISTYGILDYELNNYINKYLFFDSNDYDYTIKDLVITTEVVNLNATLTHNNSPVSGATIKFDGAASVKHYAEGEQANIGTNWYLTADPNNSADIGKEDDSYFSFYRTELGWYVTKDGSSENAQSIMGGALWIDGQTAYTSTDSLDLNTVGENTLDSTWVANNLGDVSNTSGVEIHFPVSAVTDNNGIAAISYTPGTTGVQNVTAKYNDVSSTMIPIVLPNSIVFNPELNGDDEITSWATTPENNKSNYSSNGIYYSHGSFLTEGWDNAKLWELEFDVSSTNYTGSGYYYYVGIMPICSQEINPFTDAKNNDYSITAWEGLKALGGMGLSGFSESPSSFSAITDGNWHHYKITKINDTKLRIILDDTYIWVGDYTNLPNHSILHIGSRDNPGYSYSRTVGSIILYKNITVKRIT